MFIQYESEYHSDNYDYSTMDLALTGTIEFDPDNPPPKAPRQPHTSRPKKRKVATRKKSKKRKLSMKRSSSSSRLKVKGRRKKRRVKGKRKKKRKAKQVSYSLLLPVYSPFSDRVGLPLHNIPSPFLSVMDIFFVDLKFFHTASTLSNQVLLGRPWGSDLLTLTYTPYIFLPTPYQFSSSHVHTISTYHF